MRTTLVYSYLFCFPYPQIYTGNNRFSNSTLLNIIHLDHQSILSWTLLKIRSLCRRKGFSGRLKPAKKKRVFLRYVCRNQQEMQINGQSKYFKTGKLKEETKIPNSSNAHSHLNQTKSKIYIRTSLIWATSHLISGSQSLSKKCAREMDSDIQQERCTVLFAEFNVICKKAMAICRSFCLTRMTDGKIYHFKSDNYPFSVFVGICDICGSLDRMNTFRRALDAEKATSWRNYSRWRKNILYL